MNKKLIFITTIISCMATINGMDNANLKEAKELKKWFKEEGRKLSAQGVGPEAYLMFMPGPEYHEKLQNLLHKSVVQGDVVSARYILKQRVTPEKETVAMMNNNPQFAVLLSENSRS
jgi:hypothetical protein